MGGELINELTKFVEFHVYNIDLKWIITHGCEGIKTNIFINFEDLK